MNELNDNIIKFTGSSSIMEGIEPDKSYRVGLEVECYSKEKRSRQDGTYDLVFKTKVMTCEILKDNGEIIKSKDKSKFSQKLRNAIYAKGYDYDETMPLLMGKLDDIINLIYNE